MPLPPNPYSGNPTINGPSGNFFPLVQGSHSDSFPLDIATATPKLPVVLRGIENITASAVTVAVKSLGGGNSNGSEVTIGIPAYSIRWGYVVAVGTVTDGQLVGHV